MQSPHHFKIKQWLLVLYQNENNVLILSQVYTHQSLAIKYAAKW